MLRHADCLVVTCDFEGP